jgi:hypothetical protein
MLYSRVNESTTVGLVKNAAGRFVPTEVNGETQIPFKGVDKYTFKLKSVEDIDMLKGCHA